MVALELLRATRPVLMVLYTV